MNNDLTGWFAVRTMYRNDLNVGRYLEAQGAEVFIPMHYVDVKRGGAVRQVLEPVVRNIVSPGPAARCLIASRRSWSPNGPSGSS